MKVGHRQTPHPCHPAHENPLPQTEGVFYLGDPTARSSKIFTVHNTVQKALFPVLRRMTDGRFHSGEALATALGVSRATIFNAMAQAESLGLSIHAIRGRGYRIAHPVEWLDAELVASHLGALASGFDVRVHESLESTNTALMAAAHDGAPHGTVFCCEHQRGGKGRRGRTWHSALGGSLTFSVLLRADGGLQSLSGLSLATGLAIARAVNRYSQHPAALKWPNDILVGYRKLGGILVEVQGDPNGAAVAVVGIGLNVRLGAAQRDVVDQAVVDLAEMGSTVGRNALLAACLAELHAVWDRFAREGFAPLQGEWCALDAFAGKAVSLTLPDGRHLQGKAAGIDGTGAFLLREGENAPVAFNGGEISLRLDRRG